MKIHQFLLSLFALGAAAPVAAQTLTVVEAHSQAVSKQVMLIDVRTPSEWAETGVPETAARANFNDPDFLAQAKKLIGDDTSRPVALICRSGNRSGQAAAQLRAAGYTNVFNVSGGVSMAGGWIANGLPLAKAD